MEQKLTERFATPAPERLGIGALRFGEVECRRTICRVVATYPSGYQHMVPPVPFPWKKTSALHIYSWATGRLAEATDSRSIAGSDGNIRQTFILAFGRRSYQPEQYQRWLEDSRREVQRQVSAFNGKEVKP
jgi:hypothetical protein